MAENAELRSYKKIGSILKQKLIDGLYQIGERLPPSSIAEFAAIQATRNDILRLKDTLNKERTTLTENDKYYTADEKFHCAIAEITQNEVLIKLQKDLWKYRTKSPMWQGLHAHISDREYRKFWLQDHENILNGIQRKNPALAKKAMWQHLENVKQTLFELSDIEDPDFDGFLFKVNPMIVGL